MDLFNQLADITRPETQKNHLNEFKQSAIYAHQWTSFSPERRGETLINSYNEQLTEDISELTAAGIDAEIIESYKARYINLFKSWLSAKSRCASPMITGPANFNVRKHEKANRSEDNHYNLWQEWRQRAKKAIVRKAQPVKTFSSELERYAAELESLKKNHELMKEGNKRIIKARKNGEDITDYLKDTFKIQPHMIEWTLKFGFGLSNNLANIKRIEERILILSKKQERADTIGTSTKEFEGFKVIFNHEADRIQIQHEAKPDFNTISNLKRHGFRWSPSFKAWQRQLNRNGIDAAERVLNVKFN
jgi:hypothetical protein